MTEVLAVRRRPAGPRRRAAAKADPFSGVRYTITDAFKKIGAPLDGADQVAVSREQAGIRVEVTKTVSALSHKAMLKLIGSIRFRSLKLSRFRIASVVHNGKPCFRFSFYIQGVRRGPLVIEAAAKPNLLHDIRVAADFVRQAIQAEAPMTVALPRIHDYLQRIEAAAVPPLSELKATYRLSNFSFYLTHRTKPAVRRSIAAYTRDHAVAELKKRGEWPRGYGIASASGKAVRKTEAAAVEAARKPAGIGHNKAPSIEDDTAIIPSMVATLVAEEVGRKLREAPRPDLIRHLARKADTIYSNNEAFAKKVRGRGDRGRDHLEAFMRHWAAAWIGKKDGEAAVRKLGSNFANGVESSAVTAARAGAAYLKLEKPDPADLTKLKESLGAYKDKEFPRYPKVRQITAGSLANRVLVAFGRNMTKSQILAISNIIAEQGWFASADLMLEGILREGRGWNGADQVTVFKGRHVSRVTAATVEASTETKTFKFYLVHPTKRPITRTVDATDSSEALEKLRKDKLYPAGYGTARVETVRKTEASVVEAAGRRMSDANLRKRVSDLQYQVKLNESLLKKLKDAKGRGNAEDHAFIKDRLETALAKDKAELETRLADARERGLRNGSLVNNRRL